jgi:hypothetical protein
MSSLPQSSSSTPAFSDLSPLLRSLFLAARAAEAAKLKGLQGAQDERPQTLAASIATRPVVVGPRS